MNKKQEQTDEKNSQQEAKKDNKSGVDTKNTKESKANNEELRELQQQVKELKDQCLRAYAETENLRKRSDRELVEARKFSISSVVQDLVNVIESLYQSTDHISEEDKKNEKVKKIVEGIELTRKELMTVLSKYKVKRIQPELGDVFDHNFHQALSQSPDDNYPKNTVIKVIRAGYLIEDRLVKPALVMVSAGVQK